MTTPSVSCLYEGTIRHRRREPAQAFTHRLALAYIDLDELPGLLAGRLVRRGPGLLRFRRRDYLGPAGVPLALAVRDRVAALGTERPSGPIRVLTQLRSWGLCFNPVSFYYCFDASGEHVEAVLAEVTNTPWGERHAYLLSPREGGSVLRSRFAKALHVSPFMGMDHVYEARATEPGQTVSVHIESARGGHTVFDATLALERRELTPATAAHLSVRYPLASGRSLALIYGHALGLKLAGARVHPHPGAGAGA
ncbi:MAG: uncharacterized protein QOF83_2061 [Solirubrobacteraceae bacterium]|jgi:DUF1365 family protein|nr:uncharacterized protein [Solirubrobacteraceae bacterium]